MVMKITLPFFQNNDAKKSNSGLVDPVQYFIEIIDLYANIELESECRKSILMQTIQNLERELQE